LVTLFWHDYETTGIDPARDRAIQFAGVRTDENLKPVEDPIEVYCRLSEDLVPHAEALMVSGIRLSWLQQEGLREVEFAKIIQEQFSRPGTCVVGYNSLRFDDEFSRYLFYRNFYDPYAREWQGGNSRWDTIDLFRTAYALRPEGFNWPMNDKGNPVFKLEELTRANGVSHGNAHDAVSDVMATVALTARLREQQPRLYEYYYRLRFKRHVVDQLYPLGKSAVVHVSGRFSPAKGCCAVVLPVCTHPTNTNGVISVDLEQNPESWIHLRPEEIARRVFSPAAGTGKGEERIRLKVIHINRSPSVSPLSTLSVDGAARLGIDLDRCLTHMSRLQKVPGLVDKIQSVFAQAEFEAVTDPELMLYQGDFFSDEDRVLMNRVRGASEKELSADRFDFRDERLTELLFRYRARNFPDSLSRDEISRWHQQTVDRWETMYHPKTELSRLVKLKEQYPEKREVLQDLETYLLKAMSAMDQFRKD